MVIVLHDMIPFQDFFPWLLAWVRVMDVKVTDLQSDVVESMTK